MNVVVPFKKADGVCRGVIYENFVLRKVNEIECSCFSGKWFGFVRVTFKIVDRVCRGAAFVTPYKSGRGGLDVA